MDSEQTPPTRASDAASNAEFGHFAPGTELGGYQLLEVLGTGGMGQVFRAVDAEGIEVAMKVLHPHLSRDDEARRRLRREVSALHRVRSKHVARVLDAEADGVEAFIVTELLHGLTLDQSVREEGVFAGEELATLAQQLAEALKEIHAAEVVHRDLKPSNVMLTDEGAKVIDFGIAQVGDEARITQTGLVVGTAGYLAPEVFSGAPPTTQRVDWFAWAAVLLHAATGKQPFGTGPFQAVLSRMERGEAMVADLPVGIAAGLRAGLHPNPELRAQPEQVIRQLQHPDVVLDQITRVITTTPETVPEGPMVAVPYQPTQVLPGEDGGILPFDADALWRPQHPPIPPPARGVALSLLFLGFVTGAGHAIGAFLVLIFGFWISRTVGIARVGQFRRRMRRGAEKPGVAGLVLRLPWYLVRGLGGLILPVILSVFCFVLILALAWLTLWVLQETDAGSDMDALRRAIVTISGGLGVLISALIIWRWDSAAITGRSGQPLDYDGATRVGLRSTVAFFARNTFARGLLALIIILLGFIGLFFVLSHAGWFDIFDFLHIGIPGY